MPARMPFGVTWRAVLTDEEARRRELAERLARVDGWRYLLPDRLWTWRFERGALRPVCVEVR